MKRPLVIAIALALASGTALARPKVAIVPLEGDPGGDAEEAITDALGDDADIEYKPSFELEGRTDRDDLVEALLAEVERRRNDELDRGVSLVGPHRDELLLSLGHGPGSFWF